MERGILNIIVKIIWPNSRKHSAESNKRAVGL